MLRLSVTGLSLACLAATAASFTAFKPLSCACGGSASRPRGRAISRGQRSANPFAQLAPGAGAPLQATAELAAGWISQVDEQSGHTYYMNSQTGESQWEPPLRAAAAGGQSKSLIHGGAALNNGCTPQQGWQGSSGSERLSSAVPG